MKLAALVGLLLLIAGAASAQVDPTVTVPPMPPINGVGVGFDPTNPAANENKLIQAINSILLPLFPNQPGGVNFPVFTPGTSGVGVTFSAQGSDANISLKFEPKGNGSVILFSSATNINSTGLIKVGNLASWRAATGLTACPGVNPNKPVLGGANVITGYLVIKDWLDRTHAMPGC